MGNFKHYILMRFNLGLYSDNPYNISNPDEWMEHRMDLFEEFTYKSLKSQTCKDYTVVMAFDEATPEHILCKYDYIDNVEVVFEQPHLWLKEQPIESDWLITSRLDNDDYYSPEFVKTIQDEFRHEIEIIDVVYNGVLRETMKHYGSGRARANSPFITLVEKWNEDIKTAMHKAHSIMPDYFPSRKLNKTLAYQLIHECNVINKLVGGEL